jgi:hypothetical protein
MKLSCKGTCPGWMKGPLGFFPQDLGMSLISGLHLTSGKTLAVN